MRLVSFFQDRIISHNYLGFVVATQKFNNKTEDPEGKVTFREFVNFMLYGTQYIFKMFCTLKATYFTGPLKAVRDDDHIQQQTRWCRMCSCSFDIIGKVENGFDDIDYTLVATGIGNLMPEHEWEPTMKARLNQGKTGIPTEELARTLFKSLSKEQAQGLYEFYKADFEILQYDHKELMELAGTA